jgi:hypothetical protein
MGVLRGESRQWTSADGRSIEGELRDFDGTTVTLVIGKKDYKLPIEKLSEADQEWLKAWKTKQAEESAARLKATSGLRSKAPITQRCAQDVDGYFKGPFGKGLRDFHDKTASIVDAQNRGVFMDCAESVEWKDETMVVYCPPTYKGDETPHGVYINIPSIDRPVPLRPGYGKVMERLSLIYASPSGAWNTRSDMRRVALGLDVLATLRKKMSNKAVVDNRLPAPSQNDPVYYNSQS